MWFGSISDAELVFAKCKVNFTNIDEFHEVRNDHWYLKKNP